MIEPKYRRRMMKSLVVSGMLLVPLAAALPRSASAQEPITVYQFQRCAQLGIAFEPHDSLLVARVRPGSPADRAGIRPADRVVAIDGQTVTGTKLQELRANWRPGVAVRVRLRRGDEVRDVDVVPMSQMCVEAVPLAGPGQVAVIPPAFSPGQLQIFHRNGDSLEIRAFAADSLFEELVADMRSAQVHFDSLLKRMNEREFRRLDSLRSRMLRVYVDRPEGQGWVAREAPRATLRQVSPDLGWITVAPPAMPDGFPVVVHVGQYAIAGVEFTELDPQLAEYFRGADAGLLVLRVAPESPGANAGLQPGDVVVAANGSAIRRIVDLRAAIANAGREPVTLSIVRKGKQERLVYRNQD